jgi:hypothetical protein
VASDSATVSRWRDRLCEHVPGEYALGECRVTQSLIVTVLLVYNAEILVRLALGAPTVRVAMAYSFLNHFHFHHTIASPLSVGRAVCIHNGDEN